MKEELMKNLEVILDYVKQGEDFVKEQAPLFIRELITYEIWVYSIWIIISIIVFTISMFVFKYNYKIYKNEFIDEELHFSCMVISSILALAMFIVFSCCITELIKVCLAPRYFLMQCLLNLRV